MITGIRLRQHRRGVWVVQWDEYSPAVQGKVRDYQVCVTRAEGRAFAQSLRPVPVKLAPIAG
jgi:hypothetical protein